MIFSFAVATGRRRDCHDSPLGSIDDQSICVAAVVSNRSRRLSLVGLFPPFQLTSKLRAGNTNREAHFEVITTRFGARVAFSLFLVQVIDQSRRTRVVSLLFSPLPFYQLR